MVKTVKFFLEQIDAVSSGRYTFVCCARKESGKLALLHATGLPSGSTGGVKESAALAMKRLFEAVSTGDLAAGCAPQPSSSGTDSVRVDPLTVSASSRA